LEINVAAVRPDTHAFLALSDIPIYIEEMRAQLEVGTDTRSAATASSSDAIFAQRAMWGPLNVEGRFTSRRPPGPTSSTASSLYDLERNCSSSWL
jgi:hypothetical protein